MGEGLFLLRCELLGNRLNQLLSQGLFVHIRQIFYAVGRDQTDLIVLAAKGVRPLIGNHQWHIFLNPFGLRVFQYVF